MSSHLDCHAFQRIACKDTPRPILNAACKEDPAGLGSLYNATNMDISTFDPATNRDLRTIPNYVQGDATDMQFKDKMFGTVVLGEILEHCVESAALKILSETKRVLQDNGVIVVSYPLDGRKKEDQHGKNLIDQHKDGPITFWHQTVWDIPAFMGLLEKVGLEVTSQEELGYGFLLNKPAGYGFKLRKK
jgi:SAM-dependent methyltransferase